MSPWTDLVTKVYKEEKAKNPAFQFKDAMKSASKRKNEMGTTSKPSKSKKARKRGKTRKRGKSKKHRK